MIFILDKYNTVLTAITNTSPKSAHFDNDVMREDLKGISTFEFEVPSDHEDAIHLIAENTIITRNLDRQLMLFRIKRVVEKRSREGIVKQVYTENAAIPDLRGEVVRGIKLASVNLEQASTHVLINTGWELGKCEYGGLKDVDFSTFPTALAGLYMLAEIYDMELAFRVEFDGVSISGRYIDFVKKRGTVTGKRFTYAKDLIDIERTEDSTELVTALFGIGKSNEDGTRIKINAVDDGDKKPAGQDWVGNDEALQRYGRNGKHIFGVFEDAAAQTPNELYTKMLAALPSRTTPRVTYQMNVALLERIAGLEGEKVRIGDTVIVKDTMFNPILAIEARVIDLRRSKKDPTKDSVTLGNFVELELNPDLQIEAIKREINANAGKWESGGETIIKSFEEPTSAAANQLWLDLSVTPNIMRRWDESSKNWVKATPTQPSEVGAESPEGAQDKANEAQKQAEKNAATDATNKANNAKDKAIEVSSKDATEKANKAKDDAVKEVQESLTTMERRINNELKQHAEDQAKAAEDASKLFTERFAEKEIHIGNTPPSDTSRKWIDTTKQLNVMKRYDTTTKTWIRMSPEFASDIGAETPADALKKAQDEAKKAKDAAILEAKELDKSVKAEAANLSKAAEEAAKAHTNSVTQQVEEALRQDSQDKADAARDGALSEADKRIQAAKKESAQDAQNKANAAQKAAEEAAKRHTDELTAQAEKNAKQHAEGRAKAAEEASKTFTQSYAQKEIKQQNTAPTDTSLLWLDTSKDPNILKRYDATAKKWINASPTSASQIGAETPEGAKAKADAAKEAAAIDAANKAAAAQAAAIAEAQKKADAAQKAATDRANTVEKDVKEFASNAGNITKGTIAAERLYGGTIDAQKANIVNINAGNITTGSIDASKIKVTNVDAGAITTGTLNAARIGAGTITSDKIHVNGLSADVIKTGTINASVVKVINLNASNIVAGTLDAGKVVVTNLSANVLQSGIIDASRVTVNNLDASKITAGTMSADKIKGGSIDANNVNIVNLKAGNITSGSIDASKIGVTNIKAENITTGTLNAARIAAGTITADKLHVLAKNFINNPSLSGNFTGWNNLTPTGAAAPSVVTDATRGKVIQVEGTGSHTQMHSELFEVDPNQTYKINAGLKMATNPTGGAQYIGVVCFDAAKNPISSHEYDISKKTFTPIQQYAYFLKADKTLYPNWTDFEGYLLGSQVADGSEIPKGRNVGYHIRMLPNARYVHVRILVGYQPTAPTQKTVAQIYSPSVSTSDSGSIVADQIVAGTIDASKVNVTKINASNITTGGMSADRIVAGTIDARKVSVVNLNAGNIITGYLDASKVTVANLDASKITTGILSADRIGAGAISADKIAANAVTVTKIYAGAVTAEKIATNAITADKIAANAVNASKIAAGTITGDKIAAGAITATMIQAGVLDASKVDVQNLSAAKITSGTMSADRITGGTIDAAKTNVVNLNATNIKSGAINANLITTGTLDASKVTVKGLHASAITSGTIDASKITISNGKVTINNDGIAVNEGDFSTVSTSGLKSNVSSGYNLIADHSFECIAADGERLGTYYNNMNHAFINLNDSWYRWARQGTPRMIDGLLYDVDARGAAFGRRAGLFNMTNNVFQSFDAQANQQYTISFHAARPFGLTAGKPTVSVEFFVDGDRKQRTVHEFAIPASQTQFTRYGVTVQAPANLTGGRTRFGRIYIHTPNADWCVFDGIQVVAGSKASHYEPENSLWQFGHQRTNLPSIQSRKQNVEEVFLSNKINLLGEKGATLETTGGGWNGMRLYPDTNTTGSIGIRGKMFEEMWANWINVQNINNISSLKFKNVSHKLDWNEAIALVRDLDIYKYFYKGDHITNDDMKTGLIYEEVRDHQFGYLMSDSVNESVGLYPMVSVLWTALRAEMKARRELEEFVYDKLA